MSKKRITRISAVQARGTKGRTDWKRVRRLIEREIARAAAGDPDATMTTAADWANARVVGPQGRGRLRDGANNRHSLALPIPAGWAPSLSRKRERGFQRATLTPA